MRINLHNRTDCEGETGLDGFEGIQATWTGIPEQGTGPREYYGWTRYPESKVWWVEQAAIGGIYGWLSPHFVEIERDVPSAFIPFRVTLSQIVYLNYFRWLPLAETLSLNWWTVWIHSQKALFSVLCPRRKVGRIFRIYPVARRPSVPLLWFLHFMFLRCADHVGSGFYCSWQYYCY